MFQEKEIQVYRKYMAQFSGGPIPYHIQARDSFESPRDTKLKGQLEFVSRFGKEDLKPEDIRKLLDLSISYNQQQQDLLKEKL